MFFLCRYWYPFCFPLPNTSQVIKMVWIGSKQKYSSVRSHFLKSCWSDYCDEEFPILVSMKSVRYLLCLGAQRLCILAELCSPLRLTSPGLVTNISPISETVIGGGRSILWTGLPGMPRPAALGCGRLSPGLRSAGGRGETEQTLGAARRHG